MKQNYVSKALNNLKTFRENCEVVIVHVLNHLGKFTPIAKNTGNPLLDEWVQEGRSHDFGFMKSFGKRYL